MGGWDEEFWKINLREFILGGPIIEKWKTHVKLLPSYPECLREFNEYLEFTERIKKEKNVPIGLKLYFYIRDCYESPVLNLSKKPEYHVSIVVGGGPGSSFIYNIPMLLGKLSKEASEIWQQVFYSEKRKSKKIGY